MLLKTHKLVWITRSQKVEKQNPTKVLLFVDASNQDIVFI